MTLPPCEFPHPPHAKGWHSPLISLRFKFMYSFAIKSRESVILYVKASSYLPKKAATESGKNLEKEKHKRQKQHNFLPYHLHYRLSDSMFIVRNIKHIIWCKKRRHRIDKFHPPFCPQPHFVFGEIDKVSSWKLPVNFTLSPLKFSFFLCKQSQSEIIQLIFHFIFVQFRLISITCC